MEVCRICLESEEGKKMISPCKCTGSQKFVHQKCLAKWQEMKMLKVLKYPELYQLSDIKICDVCKSQCEVFSVSDNWKMKMILYPIQSFIQRYFYSFLLGLLAIGFFSGIILIPVVVNLVIIVLFALMISYFTGIRPKIIVTAAGLTLAFIRVGPAVEGLTSGVLIEATEGIDSGIFAGSVVLITGYSPYEGAVGYIINKRVNGQSDYFIGGPVSPYSRHLIHDSSQVPESQQVAPGLFVGGRVSNLPPQAKSILCFGYSGWAPRQLDGEIRAGYWRIKGLATPEEMFH